MQTCPECGVRNEDGELFCGACGTYLEWAEQQAAAEPVVVEPEFAEEEEPSEPTAELAEEPASPEPVVAAEPVTVGGAAARVREGLERRSSRRRSRESKPEAEAEASAGPATIKDAGTVAEAGTATAADTKSGTATAAGTVIPVTEADTATEAEAPAAAASTSKGAPATAPAAGTERPAAAEISATRASRTTPSTPGSPATRTAPSKRTTAAAAAATTAAAATAAQRASSAVNPPQATRAATQKASSAVSAAGKNAQRATKTPAPRQPSATPPVRPSKAVPAAVKPVIPAAVKPAAAQQRRYVEPVNKEESPPAPGDLICGACGAGNAPHRNFCRRCGASLADAPVQGRDGWWRRWRARRRARKDGPRAGSRPKTRKRRRHFPTKTVVLLVILALLAGAGWYFRDQVATGYNAVLDRAMGNEQVNPDAVSASSAAPDRSAELARDGISNRSWAPDVTGNGAGEWLEFTFDEPFRLVRVLVTAGNSTDDKTRLTEARPSKVRFTITDEDGQTHLEDVTLTDSGGAQPVSLPYSNVTTVRMTILDAYGATDNQHVAVAEVEFRGR